MHHDANYAILGFIPFLGYHHVLMIFIAVAIILLCMFETHLLLAPFHS